MCEVSLAHGLGGGGARGELAVNARDEAPCVAGGAAEIRGEGAINGEVCDPMEELKRKPGATDWLRIASG
jgi:hypothetical protein